MEGEKYMAKMASAPCTLDKGLRQRCPGGRREAAGYFRVRSSAPRMADYGGKTLAGAHAACAGDGTGTKLAGRKIIQPDGERCLRLYLCSKGGFMAAGDDILRIVPTGIVYKKDVRSPEDMPEDGELVYGFADPAGRQYSLRLSELIRIFAYSVSAGLVPRPETGWLNDVCTRYHVPYEDFYDKYAATFPICSGI